jgi:hypothetical protein
MKKKIADALKTKYKSFGLSNEAWDRIASAKEETVTKDEDIEAGISDFATMDLIAKELQKMRDSEIQKRTDLQREHDDYKAKHPEEKKDEKNEPDPDPSKQPDIAKIVADAVEAAVKPIQDSFDAYKQQNSAKEASTVAKETFYANKWTTKFKDEADDAWLRITELNEAKGSKMTSDELTSKATEYFNAAVKRRGVDATKPFDADPKKEGDFDFSGQAKYLEGEGLLPEEKK